MNVKRVPLTSIKPYWRNPRRHDKTVRELKKSIQRYGYVAPIIVDKKHVIIAGHARYKALRELGYEEIDVIVADHLSEDKVKEYRIADNKLSELADWDTDALKIELREFDMDALIGFSEKEIDELLADSIGGYYAIESIVEATTPATAVQDDTEHDEDTNAGHEEPQPSVERPVPRFTDAVTDAQVQREQERLEKTFEDRSRQIQEGYVNIRCPFCDEVYVINKNEL